MIARTGAAALACLLTAALGSAATLEEASLTGAGKVRGGVLAHAAGARPVAMGEAFTAVADDASAMGWNPGGLGQLKEASGIAAYDMAGLDTSMSYAAIAVPFGRSSAVGVSLMALTYGDYDVRDVNGMKTGTEASPSDMAASISFSVANPGKMGWSGISVEGASESIGGTLMGLSIGSVVPVNGTTSVGWVAQHIGIGHSLPTTMKIGGVCAVPIGGQALSVALDVAYSMTRQQWISAGVEYVPHSMVAVRVGYKRYLQDQGITGVTGVTGGLGVRFAGFGLDYAYQPFGDLTTSHRISIVFGMPRGETQAQEGPAPARKAEPVARKAEPVRRAEPAARKAESVSKAEPASKEEPAGNPEPTSEK